MQVILIQDVPKVGRRFDLKEVKAGYARNFLFKQNLGIEATSSNKQKLEIWKKQMDAEGKIKKDLWQMNLSSLRKTTLSFSAKVNEQGHLFEGIKKEALLEKLKTEHHLEIDPEELVLEKPIKVAGQTKIPLKSGGELTVEVNSN